MHGAVQNNARASCVFHFGDIELESVESESEDEFGSNINPELSSFDVKFQNLQFTVNDDNDMYVYPRLGEMHIRISTVFLNPSSRSSNSRNFIAHGSIFNHPGVAADKNWLDDDWDAE